MDMATLSPKGTCENSLGIRVLAMKETDLLGKSVFPWRLGLLLPCSAAGCVAAHSVQFAPVNRFFSCCNLDLTKRGLRNPILSQSHDHSLTFSTAVIHRSLESVVPVTTHGRFSDTKITQVNMKTFLPLPWDRWAGWPFLIAEEQQGVTLCTGQSN